MRSVKAGSTLLSLFLCLFLVGCGLQDGSASGALKEKQNQNKNATKQFFAMDTIMNVTCYGSQCDEAVQLAQEEVERLDFELSIGEKDSQISKLNKEKSLQVSDEVLVMVQKSKELYQASDGAFDITIYPLMELWGFTTGNFTVPSEDRIDAIRKDCGSNLIQIDDKTKTITIGKEQGIDLGGIAKGYTSDRLMELFKEKKITSAYVSLGGNVQCLGTKPDGSKWRIGIQNPSMDAKQSDYFGVVSVADKAVVTSGAYERYFIDDQTGQIYHHMIDPSTGYPAKSDLISVTIVANSGMLADGLSTTCYVMGLEKSITFWRNYDTPFDMILMDQNKEVYITKGLEGNFKMDGDYQVIE